MAIEPEEPAEIPIWIRRTGQIAWRLLAAAILVWVVAELVQELTLVVVPIAIALLLTAVFQPLARRLDRNGLPGWSAPLAIVVTLAVALTAVVFLVGVRVADQLPDLRNDFRTAVEDLEDRWSIELPALPGTDSATGASDVDGGPTATDAARVVRLGSEILFAAFLSLALTFLFLKDGPAMWQRFVDALDEPVRADVAATGSAAWNTLGAYVRGLTAVATFDAVGIGIGLLILGVPLVLTLVVLQFVASYIPTIGAFVAGAVAALVAFGSHGLPTALGVVALAVVVQQIGNNVIEPWIMGRALHIQPAAVLIAVSTGAILWGIAGALLFVPLTAAGSAATRELRARSRLPG